MYSQGRKERENEREGNTEKRGRGVEDKKPRDKAYGNYST
jgi:hypothetical protein